MSDMSDARILIVEDEAIEAMDLQQRLTRIGYPEPLIAISGEEGVRKAEEIHPNLVLMDIMMPGKMDGIAAAEEIRSRFDIPIIFLTAYADEETLGRAKAAGPHGYIVKPFQERELHITIDMALYKHRFESELLRSEARFRALVTATAEIVWTTDAAGNIDEDIPTWRAFTGQTPEQVRGAGWAEALHPDDRQHALEAWQRAVQRRSLYEIEYRVRRHDGAYRWFTARGVAIRDAAGAIREWVGYCVDITEHKQTEAELQEHRDQLETLVKERTEALREKSEQLERQFWIRDGQNRLNERMSGGLPVEPLANAIMVAVAEHIGAQVGALFLLEDSHLKLTGRYAYRAGVGVPEVFALGEGLVGQAAAGGKPMLLSDVPPDYVMVGSGLGQTSARQILAVPFRFGNDVTGVIELAALESFSELQREFLDCVMVAIGIAIRTAQANALTRELLTKSQQLTEELEIQQEELKSANEELEQQTRLLQQSEDNLRAQQEELQISNEELEEKNDLLKRQKQEVERTRTDLSVKAEELAMASKYKSEFLANMSHELRTPLNSLLLLAQSLTRNKEGNLTTEQVESAGIIHDSGSELLRLINEILDLSKIEAGHMELQLEPVRVSELADGVRADFGHMAGEKGLTLDIIVRDDAPAEIVSDCQRVEQILRNLLSNAIKFTEHGSVTVTFGQCSPSDILFLSVAVADTGIGIAPEYRKRIFEAFQQADGSTSRKYGGTGLGLSIARELTRLLGGRIEIQSELDNGSTFTLLLPVQPLPKADAQLPVTGGIGSTTPSELTLHHKPAPPSPDDRGNLVPDDRVILIIEDDGAFAGILRDQCRDRSLKCLIAPTGEEGLELAVQHQPDGVLLDLRLPRMDGWAVLAALKKNILTRHIPVHVLSVVNAPAEARRKGAVGFALKPLSQEDIDTALQRLEQAATGKPKRVLVVEDDAEMRRRIVTLIGNGDVTVDEAATAADALGSLRAGHYDCLVLDLSLPDRNGDELLTTLQREGLELPPVVIHTARTLTENEERVLREHAESIIIKDARSQERLFDEVSLFLHRVVSRMPENQRKTIASLYDSDAMLRDKTVLVVDDDMRTTFAVSRLLAEHGMKPLKAENGERALRLLAEHPETDLILMDIMMPIMDGYEAMRQIRDPQSPIRNHKVPIIVLTAKAMPEDRQKCIEAGADDYLDKPLDETKLLSMLRVWLYR